MGYRFLIATGAGALTVNAAGLHEYEVTDAEDFRLSIDPAPAAPGWAVPARWEDPVAHGTAQGVRHLCDGDLGGIREHLDQLVDLGVTAIYLTPVFPATSNHRYDAATFEHVDPLLGGDRALQQLTDAAHARGLRIIGDLTLNHTGSTHEWFTAAMADPQSVEAGFYLFSDHPHAYETFAGVRTMPKLDHRESQLRQRLFEGPGSVVHRYLARAGLDGWRIDVAQSAGHAAFTRPVWSWLAEQDIDRYWGVPAGHAPYTGQTMAHVMDAWHARIPWRSRVHSLNLLDSHDTPRLPGIVGRQRYIVALGLMLTMPGVPMLFAGDEIGTEGVDPEDARRPFRWNPATWDQDLLTVHRRLIELRRAHAALVDGGFRWVHTDDDVVAFERVTREQTILVHAARGAHPPLVCAAAAVDLLGDHHLNAGDSFPHTGAGIGVWQLVTGSDRLGG
nr:alpha-amylase family glycosyl hydrolase [Ornithinimicrobium sediminis]